MALAAQKELQEGQPITDRNGSVCVLSPERVRAHPYWPRAFGSQHKDNRYYDLINDTIEKHAIALGARLIVLKEFPSYYREALACFERRGFTRIPSMPLTRLNISYRSFDEYMQSALNSATRSKLRKKFKATAGDVPIELHVSNDIGPVIDEVYPLYLNVYRRSKMHFEKLTKDYFCRLGQIMPERVRFFVWRRNGKAVAFSRLQRRSSAPSLPLCFPRLG